MNELFPIAEVTAESPRLAWLKRHGVKTAQGALGWSAWRQRDSCACHGDTENDAIADLADLMGVPLWNEEELAATKQKNT